jgi:hypothetical protein
MSPLTISTRSQLPLWTIELQVCTGQRSEHRYMSWIFMGSTNMRRLCTVCVDWRWRRICSPFLHWSCHLSQLPLELEIWLCVSVCVTAHTYLFHGPGSDADSGLGQSNQMRMSVRGDAGTVLVDVTRSKIHPCAVATDPQARPDQSNSHRIRIILFLSSSEDWRAVFAEVCLNWKNRSTR